MMFFLATAIASSRTTGAATAARRRPTGNEMDTYAADVAAWPSSSTCATRSTSGISTGGGEVAHTSRGQGAGAWPRRC
jgi:hypothetical protein